MPDAIPPADPSYEGGAFHPELPSGRASGRVSLSTLGVQFTSEGGGCALPIEGLRLGLGGASDGLIFFTHPAQPQVTIHTADHGILDHAVVTGIPALAAQRARARGKQRATTTLFLALAGGLLCVVLGLFMARGWMVSAAAASVPAEWEVKAGDAVFSSIISGKRVITDAGIAAQLQALTTPLVKGIDDDRYPLKFHIIEDATLNAFAIPGGNVVLHTGLLLAAETPEEVAGVLAHEIAHITRRHSIRNILSSAGVYLAASALLGDLSGILGVLASNSALLLDRKFTRDFEREADEHGWDYLLRSGIDPRGMITFFKKMQAEEQRLGGSSPESAASHALEVLSTHPATGDRITTLEKKWTKLSTATGYRAYGFDYAGFKQALRAQLTTPAKSAP